MPQHCDPDVLDQAAMGTLPLSDSDRAHVAECEECTETLTALGHVVAIARGAAGMELVEPPPSVWQGITAQVSRAETPAAQATVVSLPGRSRTRRGWARWTPLAVAAAVGLVIGGVLTGVVTSNREPVAPTPTVVASADLTPLPGQPVDPGAAGSAVIKRVDGKDVLVLDTTGLPRTGGFYEVWLMDPTTAGLISLGSVGYGDQQTSLVLPANVRLDQFSVVDISDEPMDGNPAHSTVSVLRGKLSA